MMEGAGPGDSFQTVRWIDLGKAVCWLAEEPVRDGPVLTIH